MAQQSVIKRSAAAAAANTDTTIFTPAAGIKYKLLMFFAANEVAAQAAGQLFELRLGANIIAVIGYDLAAAPVGMMTKPAIIAHEFIGDGVTAVIARNLVALSATSVAIYNLAYDAGY